MSRKNIAPNYLRRTKHGHWYFFKLKDGFKGYGYHDSSLGVDMRLIPLPNGCELCVYNSNLSYFRPVSKSVIKRLINQAEKP